MSDDRKQRQGGDRKRISMDQEHEVRYWTEKLGVSREDLERAVQQVGDQAEKVREHLKGATKSMPDDDDRSGAV